MTHNNLFEVVVVVNGCSRLQGGLFHSVRRIWQEVQRSGARVSVKTLEDPYTAEDSKEYAPLPVEAFRAVGPRKFNYSPDLARGLERDLADGGSNQIISSHGLWIYPSYISSKLSQKFRRPLMIHPEGMLEPWALNFGRQRKKIIGQLFQNEALNRAACMRALCPPEAANFRRYGVRSPVATIPNGIDLKLFEKMPGRDELEEIIPAARDRKRLLFLSRIHPKKGLIPLMEAWAKLPAAVRADWLLIVAGPDEAGHEQQVKSLADSLEIGESLAFPGPLHGQAKLRALAGADLFLLPSFSEGFSIALLEAAACGIPVLQTPQCNFPELTQAGAAIEASPEPGKLASALEGLMGLPERQRVEMGARGKALVRDRYTWEHVGSQMTQLCHWILEGGTTPDFVSLQ